MILHRATVVTAKRLKKDNVLDIANNSQTFQYFLPQKILKYPSDVFPTNQRCISFQWTNV